MALFRMAKVLTINTQMLDAAVETKRSADVPYPTVLTAAPNQANQKSGEIQWMKNAPLVKPRLITEAHRHEREDEHRAP